MRYVFQRETDKPLRNRAAIPNENIAFNRVLSLDLIKMDKRPLLHAVVRDTKIFIACFMNSESS